MSWPLVKLADIAKVVTGATPKKRSEYYDGDIPFVTPGDLGETSGITSTSRTLTQEGANSVRSIPVGSVMVCCIGATIGKVGIAEKTVVTNQQINSLVVDERKAFPKYVYYYCATLKEKLKAASSSTTMPIVNKSNFSQFEIPLPPLEVQKRIAAILDKADAIRQKRKQAIELADEFLRSVFLDMFGDPVTNPKGFPVKVLSELYVDPKGGTKCGPFGSALKKQEFVDAGIPVWNMDNISLSGVFKDDPNLWVTREKYEEIEAYSVQDGDVIISRAGTVGKMGVVRSKHMKSLISTNLIRVRFSSHLLPEYFVALMTYCKGRVGRLKTGPDGSFTHMNTGILDQLEFPYPPIDTQRKFIEIVESTNQLMDKSNSIGNEQLFDALSQKAFSGQL